MFLTSKKNGGESLNKRERETSIRFHSGTSWFKNEIKDNEYRRVNQVIRGDIQYTTFNNNQVTNQWHLRYLWKMRQLCQ